MQKPKVVILSTDTMIRKFYTNAAKMAVCDYDIDLILKQIFLTIGSGDQGRGGDESDMMRNLKLYRRMNYASHNEHDATVLRRAVNVLARELHEQCVDLGMYDELGQMEYVPTAWVTGGDIVLTHIGEVPVKCPEQFNR